MACPSRVISPIFRCHFTRIFSMKIVPRRRPWAAKSSKIRPRSSKIAIFGPGPQNRRKYVPGGPKSLFSALGRRIVENTSREVQNHYFRPWEVQNRYFRDVYTPIPGYTIRKVLRLYPAVPGYTRGRFSPKSYVFGTFSIGKRNLAHAKKQKFGSKIVPRP